MTNNGEHDNIEEAPKVEFSQDDYNDLRILLTAFHDLTLIMRDALPQREDLTDEQKQAGMLNLAAYHAGTHYFLDEKLPAAQAQDDAANLESELEEFLNSLND